MEIIKMFFWALQLAYLLGLLPICEGPHAYGIENVYAMFHILCTYPSLTSQNPRHTQTAAV